MPPDLLTLDVPVFPRLADYSGVWAIEPNAGNQLLDMARRTDLIRHVAEASPPKLRSEVQTVKAGNNQQIAVVMLCGPLMKATSSMTGGTSTVQARRELRKAVNDPEVSAILVAIDSPGGTVSGTADLAGEIKAAAAKKPTWAYIDDLGASAAYWAASAADRIFANDRTALVGSIGTLAVVYDLSAAAEKEGIKTLVFGTGPLKGAGAAGAPVTEEQQAYFRSMVEDAQVSFDAAVRKGRALTDKQLADAKTGGVFGASEALDRKLIDGIKSFEQVVTELAAEARRQSRSSNTRAASPVPVRSSTMEENVIQPTGTAAAPVVDVVAAQNAAAAANLKRIADIQAICASHPAIAAEAIGGNWSVEKAEAAANKAELEKLRASLANGVQAMGPGAIIRSHDRDVSLQALQAAMILRFGGSLESKSFGSAAAVALKLPGWLRAGINADQRQQAMEWGHKLSHMSAVDLCREALRLDGKDVPFERQELIRAAFSGSALTNIFTTSVNARLLTSYTAAPDTTMGWTSENDVADFKTNERPRVEIGDGLTKLPRGSEAEHADYADKLESYKIARYAKQFVVDEQDMIDDSMQVFSETPAKLGQAAAWLRPDLVYSIMLDNPTLTATGRDLFNTTDGNLNTTSALTATTLKAAAADMMLFQENGRTLNLQPTHLIIPPTLYWTARELIESGEVVTGENATKPNKNVLQGLASIVADGRLENGVTDPSSGTAFSGSSSTWWLACANALTIEVGYLRGTGRAPQVRSFVLTQGKWGMGWDVNMDIGAKALDWRGFHQNTA